MQATRKTIQAGFLGLTLVSVFVFKANAERWCPFGGVEALKTYVTEGSMTCSLGISNFYALAGLLAVVLLVRRAFCSHICPIGTITEWLGKLGAKLGFKPRPVPERADRWLSLLKYGVLVLIVWVTWSANELLFRTADPCYALISRHGADITFWAYVVSGGVLIGALFTWMPFCRWLCPLAAVMNPLSRFGFARIVREEEGCVGCGKCRKACPMQIPVDERVEVRDASCTSCLTCVSACPTRAQGALSWGPPRRWGAAWPQPALAVILLAAVGLVVTAAYAFPIASFVKTRGDAPGQTASLDLRLHGIDCRGSSNLLFYFLTREDVFELPGYLKLETWPSPSGFSRVRVTYDPAATGPDEVCEAIVMPIYEDIRNFERESPFDIEGYAPWAAP